MSEEESPPRPGLANWLLAAVIGAFGLVVFVVTVATGWADSALLFVGLPTLLAMALALVTGRTTHGRVFQLTTIFLLLSAVALHEGAICVLLAAPLVYLVAHGVTALVRSADGPSRRYSLLPVPLLLLLAAEGTGDGLRINPDQSVRVVRIVAMPADQVLTRLAAGPQPEPVRSVPLRLLGVPVPHQVTGDGLDTGDRWAFAYHRTSHGPGGHILAQVSARGPERITFTFVEDTSVTARWLTWQSAELRWRAVDAERTEVRMTVRYQRRLDPSWYFGPLQDALLHEGAGHLLDMMALT